MTAPDDVTNTATLQGAGPNGEDLVRTQTGRRTLAADPETFSHDEDGNLTGDSLWTYRWNGENRLVELESRPGVAPARRKKLNFTYDHQGRRITKTVHAWSVSSNTYLPSATNVFVYDGWNPVVELAAGAGPFPTRWITEVNCSIR